MTAEIPEDAGKGTRSQREGQARVGVDGDY